MKIISVKIILIALLISLSNCTEKFVDEASGSFKALSYNVAGLPDFVSSSNPIIHTSIISPLLNNYDIVHVQEDFCYHDSLILFNKHPFKTPPMPCVPDGDGLNTFSNYDFKKFERVTWTDCYGFDCLTPKGFSFSRLEFNPGVTIDFYNIHCNAGGSQEDKAARRSNILQLSNYINTHSQDQAVILMGDFNCRYTRKDDTIRTLLNMGFTDTYIELIQNNIVPGQSQSSLNNCFPLNTSKLCEGVDKILYKGTDELILKASNFLYGDDPDFLYQGIDTVPLSDHPPLSVTFSYEFKRK